MRKLKLFLSLLMLFAFSLGNVWAADVTYSLTPNATSTGSSATNYQASLTFTYNEIGWSMAQFNPSTRQTKTNQSSATAEFNFHNTSAFPGRITKVVVTYSALTVATGKASEFKFLGGTSEVTATTGGDAATWNSTNKTMTWTPAANTNYTYFAYYMNGKTATGSNFLAESDAIVVTYETSGGGSDPVAVTGVTLDQSEAEVAVGKTITLTPTVAPSNATTKTVTWESDDEDVATVDGGVVTGVAEGTATITVKTTDGNKTATCEVMVTAAPAAVNYEKVTAEPADWSGEYILVYEADATNARVWKGADEANNYAEATIATGAIAAPEGAAVLTIAKVAESNPVVYTIMVGDKYIGQTSDANGMKIQTTAINNSISYNGTDAAVDIVASSAHLRYNSASSSYFRYYKSATYSSQKKIQLYKKVEGAIKPAAGLEYAEADLKKLAKLGDAFTAPTLTNPNSLSVTYTSSNTEVAEVAGDGTLTIKAVGVAEITASSEETDTYKAGSAKYTIYVVAHDGTEADPYTVADARVVIDAGVGVTGVYMSGIVSGIATAYNSQYGNISFNLSDDGLTTSNQVQAYRCFKANGDWFTSEDDIKVGATATIYGNLKKHYATYEFDQNCQLVAYEAPAVPQVDITNTKETAYTVSNALALTALEANSDLTKKVYIKGVVYKANSYNSTNGTYNIYIREDGKTEEDGKFEFYKCLGLNSEKFAENGVQVGDKVIGYGTMTYYADGDIWEFQNGCYLVELVRPEVAVTGIELTESVAEVEVGNTVTLHASIAPTTATNQTIIWTVESGDSYASVDENGVVSGIAEGEAVVRATSAADNTKYAECTVTVNAAAPVVDTRMVAESPEEGFSSISGNLNSDISFAAYKGGAQNEPNGSNTSKELRLYKYQATTDFGGYVTINAKKGFKIDQVIITVSANAKVGYCKDAEAFPTKESTPISIGTSAPFNTGTGLNAESVNVVNIDGSNQFKITHITVYYTGAAEAFASYELSGEYATAFQQDAEFNHDNLVVYGVYADNSKVDITADCSFSTPDMSQTGEQTITITYKEQDIKSYTINVAEVGTAVVKFFAPASWEKVYICTWDGTTGNHEMEDAGDGWYSYELQKGTNYLFYTGENIDNFAIQTVDLYNIQAPLCYAWTNNWDGAKMLPVVVSTCEMNYHLSGKSFPNGSWEADAFALDANNRYVFNALPAGTYSFKVTNGTWDWNLGYDNRDDENSNVTLSADGTNIQFTTDAEMNVTIAYNPATAKISVNAEKPFVPNIQFGKNIVKINDASINGTDNYGNTWNVASVFSGGAYFNNYENPEYAQVGSGNKPVSSVTFTTTLPSNAKVKDFAIKLGGFNDTEGTITLKVGETVVGSGSLNGAEDVVISANNLPAYGNTLTIEATELNRLKVYGIAYSYEEVVKVSFFAPYDETNKWQTVYAYAWEYDAVNDVTTTLSAAWPGEDISASKHSGWYDFYVKKGANVIFNDNNFQTYDLNNIEADVCYVATAIDYEAKKVTATESANCDVDYYISDAANGLTAANWNAAAEDGKLVNGSITFQAVPAGTYEFKLTNGSWAWSIGRDNLNSECTTITVDGEYSNVRFQTTEIQDITISYDAETGKICLDADVVKFDATIASIADQNIVVGEATTIARPVTDPEDAIIKYEVVEGTAASIDNDGKITGLAAGDARVRAYIEETETHHSAETFFYVHVTCQEVVSTVVILAQLSDDSWIAMNHDMKAVAVDYHDGKIFDLDETDQETIKWTRTELCDVTTFQNPADDMYLLGNTGGTGLSLAEYASGNNKKEWVWNGDYYHVGEATRTFLYQGGTTAAFKNYAVSNAYPEKENYSTLPIVVVPEFATTPVEPEWETVRENLEPNRYYTVCLPKKMMEVRGASFWTLSSRNTAETEAYLEEVDPTTAEAGTPFIIQATDTKLEVVYTGAATTTAGTNGALHGTLTYMDADALAAAGTNIYMLYNNALRPVGNNNHLDANRAYINYDELNPVTEAPQPAPGRRVRAVPMQQNTATGIDELNGSEAPAKVLINGQLFILRGEKMYDAKGLLVK